MEVLFLIHSIDAVLEWSHSIGGFIKSLELELCHYATHLVFSLNRRRSHSIAALMNGVNGWVKSMNYTFDNAFWGPRPIPWGYGVAVFVPIECGFFYFLLSIKFRNRVLLSHVLFVEEEARVHLKSAQPSMIYF